MRLYFDLGYGNRLDKNTYIIMAGNEYDVGENVIIDGIEPISPFPMSTLSLEPFEDPSVEEDNYQLYPKADIPITLEDLNSMKMYLGRMIETPPNGGVIEKGSRSNAANDTMSIQIISRFNIEIINPTQQIDDGPIEMTS